MGSVFQAVDDRQEEVDAAGLVDLLRRRASRRRRRGWCARRPRWSEVAPQPESGEREEQRSDAERPPARAHFFSPAGGGSARAHADERPGVAHERDVLLGRHDRALDVVEHLGRLERDHVAAAGRSGRRPSAAWPRPRRR